MTWPLVGRDRELVGISELLAGGAAHGVVMMGAAGVGKTRLATEIARLAESRGCAVEWVRATRSAASMPLGAFAALLPPAGGEGAELLARARRALADRADGRLVLCVDDGQLLDEASAVLVHQIVAAGEAFSVVTVRRGEPAPDALRALWKDELCSLVELEELSRAEVDALVERALGGPVDGRTRNALEVVAVGAPLGARAPRSRRGGGRGGAGGTRSGRAPDRWPAPVGGRGASAARRGGAGATAAHSAGGDPATPGRSSPGAWRAPAR